MNGDEQVRQDKIIQEQRREFARGQLRERMREKGGFAKMGGDMVRGAGKSIAAKGGLKKFEKALGKGAKKIKAKQHSAAAWMIALLLAVAKDLLDIGTIELASWIDWIVDICIGVTFFFLFGKSVKLTRKLIMTIGATILEVIPFVGFLPSWTLSVVYLMLKAGQEE